MSEFNPTRLRVARERAHLSKVELGQLVGLTARRVGDFETRGAVPPTHTLERLASTLQVPASFLSQGAVPTVENLSFRSQSRMRAATRKAALATSCLAAEFGAWLSSEFTFDEVTVPSDLAGAAPDAAAAELRGRLGLGVAPAPNLIHLSELLGVRVLAIASSSPHLDAFSFWAGHQPFIMLNHSGTAERRRWNVAHELGHLVLHRGAHHLPSDRGREDEADSFAAELLLPADGLRKAGASAAGLSEVLEQRKDWAVSATALIRRLHDLGWITEWTYRSIMIEASAAGLRRAEDVILRETSPTLTSVVKTLAGEGISFGRVAEKLDFPVALVEELLHGLTVVPLTTTVNVHHRSSPRRPELQLVPGGRPD